MAKAPTASTVTTKSAVATNDMPPSEIARETIKRMAMERIAPTPEHYQRIYNQIANIPQSETLDSALSKALQTLPRDTTEHTKWIRRWEKLISDGNFDELPELLAAGMESKVAESRLWPDTIRDLIKVWDLKQTTLPQQRKKETLERVLINFGNDPQLPQKIQAMTKTWSEYSSSSNSVSLVDELDPVANVSATMAAMPLTDAPPTAMPSPNSTPINEPKPSSDAFYDAFKALQEMLRQTLMIGLVPRLEGYPELRMEAQRILEKAERSKKITEWQDVNKDLKGLLVRVELIGADETSIRNDLLNLLKLLIDNISELVVDDKWLQGQIAVVQTIISSPLEKALIKDAEKSLKEIIFKQGTLKHSLTEAKHNFKQMIQIFVERLSDMSDSTGNYQNKVEGYADRLAKTDDIAQINVIVEHLMHDTRIMQTDILRSKDAMEEQQQNVALAEAKIRQLERELSDLSDKVRIDQLTGVLNRRGLEDAFLKEVSRAQRGEGLLSVALLDIDNFKKLNDTLGHDAGDKALQHLASVVKETIRPTDVVARFGGEEFVILLPNTPLNEGVEAVVRLQRELTKKFFLHNNERLLVTFSAGVALFKKEEDQSSVLQRADKAMYLAKKSGKNRVMNENDLLNAQMQ